MSYSCDIKIMGIPSRIQQMIHLSLKLGLTKSDWSVDDKGVGLALANSMNAFNLPYENDITHRCVIQDDVDVCDDFIWFINHLVNRFPDAVWSLFHRSKVWQEFPEHSIAKMGGQIWGQAVIIPRKYIPLITEEWKAKYSWRGPDDTYYANWCYLNKVPVLSTVPCGVSHLGVFHNSSLKHEKFNWTDVCYSPNGMKTEWLDMTSKSLKMSEFPRVIKIMQEQYDMKKNGRY